MAIDVLVLEGLARGPRLRMLRPLKGLRQLNVASMARLQLGDVSYAGRDFPIPHWKWKRICQVFEIELDPVYPEEVYPRDA